MLNDQVTLSAPYQTRVNLSHDQEFLQNANHPRLSYWVSDERLPGSIYRDCHSHGNSIADQNSNNNSHTLANAN